MPEQGEEPQYDSQEQERTDRHKERSPDDLGIRHHERDAQEQENGGGGGQEEEE